MLGVIIKGMRREYMEAYRRYNEPYFKLPTKYYYMNYKESCFNPLLILLGRDPFKCITLTECKTNPDGSFSIPQSVEEPLRETWIERLLNLLFKEL